MGILFGFLFLLGFRFWFLLGLFGVGGGEYGSNQFNMILFSYYLNGVVRHCLGPILYKLFYSHPTCDL